MRISVIFVGVLLSVAAYGQPLTPSQIASGLQITTRPPVPRTTPRKTPKPGAHKAAPPVIAPHRGKARKPVHPAAPVALVTPKTPPAPAKPVAPRKPSAPADEGTVTHLHLPRYVSLRSDEVNMRSGPGERYPVKWQYKRKDLPVKIEREFDIWRLVEDMDGVQGWVHQATLTGRRTFVLTGIDPQTLRADANDTAAPVALVKPGVVGRVLSCDAGAAWCRVQIGDYRGFLPRTSFWGTEAGEAVAP